MPTLDYYFFEADWTPSSGSTCGAVRFFGSNPMRWLRSSCQALTTIGWSMRKPFGWWIVCWPRRSKQLWLPFPTLGMVSGGATPSGSRRQPLVFWKGIANNVTEKIIVPSSSDRAATNFKRRWAIRLFITLATPRPCSFSSITINGLERPTHQGDGGGLILSGPDKAPKMCRLFYAWRSPMIIGNPDLQRVWLKYVNMNRTACGSGGMVFSRERRSH